jgi:hypothetical protein
MRFSNPPARQRHSQDRDHFADDRADRGHRWATYNAVTERLDRVVPVRRARTASDSRAGRALRSITAPGGQPIAHSPSIPDAANPLTGHAAHRAWPARQSTRRPGPFFFRNPSARLPARHHGDTLSPNQLSRSLRTAVSTREIIPVPHPPPRHVDIARLRGPAPDADPSSPYHATPHTTMSRCASTRQVNTTLAASNPTTPPPQRRRPNRGAPLRTAPPPGPAAPSQRYRRDAPPRDRPGWPCYCLPRYERAPLTADPLLLPIAPERMPCYCRHAAP